MTTFSIRNTFILFYEYQLTIENENWVYLQVRSDKMNNEDQKTHKTLKRAE